MGKIGSFGKTIVFEVTSKKILTPTNVKKEIEPRWESFDRILQKPKKQFLGPGDSSLSMDIRISGMHGQKPRKTIEKIEEAAEKGKIDNLIIGGKKVFQGKCYISKISEEWECIYNKGELMAATISLAFSEYA